MKERKTVSSQCKKVRLKKIIAKEADLVIKMTKRKTAERGEEGREKRDREMELEG